MIPIRFDNIISIGAFWLIGYWLQKLSCDCWSVNAAALALPITPLSIPRNVSISLFLYVADTDSIHTMKFPISCMKMEMTMVNALQIMKWRLLLKESTRSSSTVPYVSYPSNVITMKSIDYTVKRKQEKVKPELVSYLRSRLHTLVSLGFHSKQLSWAYFIHSTIQW